MAKQSWPSSVHLSSQPAKSETGTGHRLKPLNKRSSLLGKCWKQNVSAKKHVVHIGPQCMMGREEDGKEGHNSAEFLNQPGAFHGRLRHGAMIAHGSQDAAVSCGTVALADVLLWSGHHLGCLKSKYSETDSTDPNRFQQVKRGREFVPTFLGGHWPARASLNFPSQYAIRAITQPGLNWHQPPCWMLHASHSFLRRRLGSGWATGWLHLHNSSYSWFRVACGHIVFWMSPKNVAETGEPNQTCSTSVDYPQFAQTLYRMPFMPTLRIIFRDSRARWGDAHIHSQPNVTLSKCWLSES